MSEIKVNSIKGVGASAAAITVNNTDGTCTANITNNLSNRNLIINGAMQVAQRGTSSTTNGYGSVDRFKHTFSGTDEAPTFAQVDVSSGTTPYTLGFRKALKITNGNQTSVGSSDQILIDYRIEAQDIANSGWNYTSASSFITLSFWVKSSVAQNFHGFLLTADGTAQLLTFSTGSLTEDTWTKVTKTIPGNSNLQFDNNENEGLLIRLAAFYGTGYTSSMTENQWAAFSGSSRMNNNTSTWYEADNATFEVTGFQLEVGSVATDFEHLSYGDTLAKCQRYYFRLAGDSKTITTGHQNGVYGIFPITFPQVMRTAPTATAQTVTDAYSYYHASTVARVNSLILGSQNERYGNLESTSYNTSDGTVGLLRITNSSAYIDISAEL